MDGSFQGISKSRPKSVLATGWQNKRSVTGIIQLMKLTIGLANPSFDVTSLIEHLNMLAIWQNEYRLACYNTAA